MIADLSGDMKTWRQNGIGDGYLMNYSDASGAITRKTDLGYYTDFKYESSKPHAVTSLENIYDASPSLPSTQLAATYTNFKKLATLTEGDKSYALTYGVDDQRRRSTYSDRGTVKQTRYYLGDYELERQSDGSERSIHYLSGGDGLAAIYVTREFGRDSLMYVYTDNLGSITALTDANHNVMERYAYDPWGGRRNPSNWAQKDNRTAWLTNRGYTGHEHLDRFGIINMNGRVYDPLTAMFLSPDPFVQAPNNWLNYNRYGYCYNNPFRYTDPSGEWIHIVIGAAIGGTMNLIMNANKIDNFWQGLGYFSVGAAAGAVGAGVGAGISSALAGGSFSAGFTTAATTAGTSFVNGAAIGAGAGFSSGFVTGVGNGLLGGRGWNSLTDGVREGLMGGAMGGLASGLMGGLDAMVDGRRFWDGSGLSYKEQLEIIRQTYLKEFDASGVKDLKVLRPLSEANGQLERGGTRIPYKDGTLGYTDHKMRLSRKTIRGIINGDLISKETMYHELFHGKDFKTGTYSKIWNIVYGENRFAPQKAASLMRAILEYRAFSNSFIRTGLEYYVPSINKHMNDILWITAW